MKQKTMIVHDLMINIPVDEVNIKIICQKLRW